MALTRRYLFHGHSAALGGRVVRIGEGKQAKLIKDGFIDLPASSLTVVGGRSDARLVGDQLTGIAATVVRFKSATASSEGVFDDLKGHYAVTLHERSAETLTTTTRVTAEVQGLEVGLTGSNVRMQVQLVRGGFTSQSSTASGETPVQLDPRTTFEGVSFVDKAGRRYMLVVEIEPQPFQEQDTFTKLTAAASDAKFARRFGHTLFLPAIASKQAPTAPALKRTDGGAVQGTIIKPLRWRGAEFPGATIDPETRHAVRIPDLGTIYFGEISVARQSRRVTMIRAELGSPWGGDLAACDFQDNGSWG